MIYGRRHRLGAVVYDMRQCEAIMKRFARAKLACLIIAFSALSSSSKQVFSGYQERRKLFFSLRARFIDFIWYQLEASKLLNILSGAKRVSIFCRSSITSNPRKRNADNGSNSSALFPLAHSEHHVRINTQCLPTYKKRNRQQKNDDYACFRRKFRNNRFCKKLNSFL